MQLLTNLLSIGARVIIQQLRSQGYEARVVGGAVRDYLAGKKPKDYDIATTAKPEDVIELRRLCCIDATPKNTESRFIGYCLRWLRKNTEMKAVLSLADPNVGHQGIIYKATNFKEIGKTFKDGHPRILIDGMEKHARDLYDRHGTSSVEVLKEIYKDRIEFVLKKRKIVYLYELNRIKTKT